MQRCATARQSCTLLSVFAANCRFLISTPSLLSRFSLCLCPNYQMERFNVNTNAPGEPGPSNDLLMISANNPYMGTGLEQVYTNFLVQRDHCVKVLGTTFEGSPCLPGCKILIKQPCNFKRHAEAKHPTEILPIGGQRQVIINAIILMFT